MNPTHVLYAPPEGRRRAEVEDLLKTAAVVFSTVEWSGCDIGYLPDDVCLVTSVGEFSSLEGIRAYLVQRERLARVASRLARMTQEACRAPSAGDREALARRIRKQPRVTGQIDVALLREAREIVDNIVPSDEFETPLFLTALAGKVMEMWESAETASEHHQDILAVLENAVTSAAADGSISDQHLAAFRGAFTHLEQTRLVREHAETIRSEFIRQGFGPMAFLEESDETEHEEPPRT